MTIKQQGGIFGRNPTFNDVDVEGTLTVNGEPISDFGTMAQQDADAVAITGGSGDFDNLTVDVDTLFVDVTNDRLGVNNGTPLERLDVDGNIKFAGGRNNGTRKLGTLAAPHYNNSTEEDFIAMRIDAQASNNVLSIGGASGGHNSATSLDFYTGANSTTTGGTLALQINSSQDVNVKAGNLVIGTSGKGIDFSATSGTGTSELFDDYEEGSHTSSVSVDGGSATLDGSFNTLSYTKTGNVVHVSGALKIASVSSPTGNINFSLPFAASGLGTGTIQCDNFLGLTGKVPQVFINNAQSIFYVSLLDQATGENETAASVFDATTFFRVSITYKTS